MELDTSAFTLAELLLERAKKSPTARAILHKVRGKWNETTWQEYAQAVAEIAEGLLQIGLSAGDQVLIILDNSPAFAYLDLATQSVGAVSIPVAPASLHADVTQLIATLKPSAVVVQDVEWVKLALGEVDESCKVIYTNAVGMSAYQDDRLVAVETLRENGSKSSGAIESMRSRARATQPGSFATISVSSGTYGTLQAHTFTSKQVAASTRAVASRFPLSDGKFVLSHAPLSAAAERTLTLYAPLLTGAVVAFPENASVASAATAEIEPHFVRIPSSALDEITTMSLRRLKRNKGLKRLAVRGLLRSVETNSLPGVLSNLLAARFILRNLGLQRCETVLVTNAPVGGSTRRYLKSLRMPVLDVYTISASLVPIMVTNSLGEPYGEVLAGVDVGVTTLGQLQVRGELVSTSALSSSGWHETNDDAVVENGVVSVLGAKDFRKSGGQVRALEAAISTSDFISRAVVLHLSDGSTSIFLQTEPEALSSWARSADIVFTTLSAIVDDIQAQRLLVDEVLRCLQEQSLQNHFDSVIIGRRPLAVATGDLTVTGKVRLGAVATRSGDVRVRLADYRAADPRR